MWRRTSPPSPSCRTKGCKKFCCSSVRPSHGRTSLGRPASGHPPPGWLSFGRPFPSWTSPGRPVLGQPSPVPGSLLGRPPLRRYLRVDPLGGGNTDPSGCGSTDLSGDDSMEPSDGRQHRPVGWRQHWPSGGDSTNLLGADSTDLSGANIADRPPFGRPFVLSRDGLHLGSLLPNGIFLPGVLGVLLRVGISWVPTLGWPFSWIDVSWVACLLGVLGCVSTASTARNTDTRTGKPWSVKRLARLLLHCEHRGSARYASEGAGD